MQPLMNIHTDHSGRPYELDQCYAYALHTDRIYIQFSTNRDASENVFVSYQKLFKIYEIRQD